MENTNHITLTGRLGRDPELKTGANGTEYTRFSVAVNRRRAKKEDPEVCDWIECSAFNKTAAYICQYLKKGDLVVVEGRLQSEAYKDKDGTDRKSWRVMVSRVEGHSSRGQSETAAPVSGYTPIPDEEMPF